MFRRAQVLSEDVAERAVAVVAMPWHLPAGKVREGAIWIQKRTQYSADDRIGVSPFPALDDVAIDQVLAENETKPCGGSNDEIHHPLATAVTANVSDGRFADRTNLKLGAVSGGPCHCLLTAAPVIPVEADLLLGSVGVVLDLDVARGRTFHRMAEVVGDEVVAIAPAATDVADAVAPSAKEVPTEITARLRLCESQRILKSKKKERLLDCRLPVEFLRRRSLVVDNRGRRDHRDREGVRYRRCHGRRICKTPGCHVVCGNCLLACVHRLIERHRDDGLKAAEGGVADVFGRLRRQCGG